MQIHKSITLYFASKIQVLPLFLPDLAPIFIVFMCTWQPEATEMERVSMSLDDCPPIRYGEVTYLVVWSPDSIFVVRHLAGI